MINFCPVCGHPKNQDGNFCLKCGTPLTTPSSKGKPKTWVVAVLSSLCGLFLVASIVLGIFAFNKDEEAYEATPIAEAEEVEEVEEIEITDYMHDEYMIKIKDLEDEEDEAFETAYTQLEMNTAAADIYSKWDDLINEIYNHIETVMSEEDFEKLEEDELEWIHEKDKAVEEAGALYEGGSMQPMVENSTASSYTRDRCYYLLGILRQLES